MGLEYTDFLNDLRYLPIYNDSGEEIPARALVKPTGTVTAGPFGPTISVEKPDADNLTNCGVNGPTPIPIGGYGNATWDSPTAAAYATGDGTPALGDDWGTENAGWELRLNKTGYTPMGTDANDLALFMAVAAGGGGSGITSLNGLSGATQTFTNDTNVTIVSGGTAHVITWVGTLADGRIASAATWNAKQAGDATLTALAAFNTNGLLTQTAADTFTGRTITGTVNKIDVSNGDGVSGNPTLTISATYAGGTSIVTLGTVATGTWQATAVAEVYGGTNQTTYTTGDILYASAANTLSKLAAGTNGYYLKMVAGVPAWATVSAASPLTTKGDIYVFSTVDTRLAVGSNGQVLLADSSATPGLKWGSAIVAAAGSGGAGSAASLTGGVGDTGAAGGSSSLVGGAGNGAGTGGAAILTGGSGGASGAGGAATLAGGAGGGGNTAGGVGSLTGGAGAGTGAGGAVTLAGGISGNGATGNGGAASLTGGAANSTNGNGGAGSLVGGAATGNGTGGAISIAGGASAGASGTGGSVTVAAGAATGGTAGAVNIAGSADKLGFYGATAITRAASPDIGTGLVNLGLVSGTPTFSAANLTGTLPGSSGQLAESWAYQIGTTDVEAWYPAGQGNTSVTSSTKALADNGLYAVPFLSGHGGTIDRLGFYCQGTFGTNKVMLGIYEAVSSTNRYPGAKLVAATELTTAAAGAGWSGVIAATTNMIYTLSQALTPGKLYWMVMNVDVGGTLTVGSISATWPIFGTTSTLSTFTNRCWLEGTRTYDSTLPSTFPSSIAISTNVQMPNMSRRYSA